MDLNGCTLSGSIENIDCKLTIKDSSEAPKGTVAASILLDGGTTAWKKPSLTIAGGIFSGNIVSGNKGTLTIEGGKIDGSITKDTGTVSCKGGLFKQKPENNMLSSGYIVSADQIEDYYQVEQDKAAKIGDTIYSTLDTALRKAKDGETILLLKDQLDLVNYYTIDKSIILDLGGKTISTPGTKGYPCTIFVNKYDTVINITIKNGTIRNTNTSDEAFMGIMAQQRVNLTLENVTVEAIGRNNYGIYVNPKNNDVQPVITIKGSKTKISGNVAGIAVNGFREDTSPTSLIVEDGTIEGGSFGIAGNGANHNTNITMNGGKASGSACGIFHPQQGILEVNGGTIEGSTGIEIRAGDLKVSGNPEIIATGEYKFVDNESGNSSSGVGLAVAQHTTKKPISVEIKGGTICGKMSLAEANPQGNSAEDLAKVTMNITGGSFVGEVDSADVSNFISGGVYSTVPTAYLNDGSYAYKMNSQYIVAPEGYQAANWTFEKAATNEKLYIGTYTTPYVPPIPTEPITNTGTASSETATTNADISKDTASKTERKTEVTADNTEITTTTTTIAQKTAEKIVENAIAHNSARIVVDATTSMPKGSKTKVILPASTIQALSENTSAELVIKSDVSEITLDAKSVNAIAKQLAADGSLTADDTVTIIAEKTKDESGEMKFDLKVVTSKGTVYDFDGGKVSVRVQLNDSLKKKEHLVCVHIDDKGVFCKVQGSKNADGTFTFVTGHFSAYAIMDESEADEIIERQTIEKNAYLTKGVQNTTIKLSSSPVSKGIKLKWKKSNGFKVDQYQIYRATKKNGKYVKIYTAKKSTTTSMVNRKNLKKGKRYFYKIRGARTIAGKTVYTKWSNKAYRIYS